MAYTSRYRNRPFESASKSAHSKLIHSEAVQSYLKRCQTVVSSDPRQSEQTLAKQIYAVDYTADNPIQYVIAVDSGSINPIAINGGASELAVIQFGIILLRLHDLEELYSKPFVGQDDLQRLKDEGSSQLVLPVSRMLYGSCRNVADSFRWTLHDFFKNNQLLDTLRWLIYEEFDEKETSDFLIPRCPTSDCSGLRMSIPASESQVTCKQCNEPVFLTDALGFHEEIGDGDVPSGTIRNTVQIIESIVLLDNIRRISSNTDLSGKMAHILFLIDGQLMIHGLRDLTSTEKFLRAFRKLTSSFKEHQNLNLIAIEKSGAFVQYADDIGGSRNKKPLLAEGSFMLLDNLSIRRHIVLNRKAESASAYGAYSHYGTKIIFRDRNANIHVLTTPPWKHSPEPRHFPSLHAILATLEKIKCDRYDNAVLPITLINKYISLSFNPSKDILRKFLTDYLK